MTLASSGGRRPAGRVAIWIVVVFTSVVIMGVVSTWASLRVTALAGLLLAAALLWLSDRRKDSVHSNEGSAGDIRSDSPHPQSAHAAEEDVRRVLAWYRTALTERVPESGRFPALNDTLSPETSVLSGLSIHVSVESLISDRPGSSNDVRVLTMKVVTADGSSIQTEVAMGTAEEVLAEIDAGERTARVTSYLDRAARELWRGGDLDRDTRVSMVRAGLHAALPEGPDCERFSQDRTGDMPQERLLDSDRQGLWLRRCPDCGQYFVEYHAEICEDPWTFIGRVSEEEAALIRRDYDWAPAILMTRRRITGSPGRRRWEEEEITELRMGPRW